MSDLARVGEAVRRRRKQLRLTIKQCSLRAGVSDTTWGNLERGDPASEDTYFGACVALDWTDESIADVLAGREPTPVDRSKDRARETPRDELLAAVRDLTEVVRRLEERLPPPAAPTE